MTISINATERDGINPLFLQLARLIGAVDGTDDALNIDASWFTNPLADLTQFDENQHDALRQILTQAFGQTSAESLGVPVADSTANQSWHPIPDATGANTGIYAVLGTLDSYSGLGVQTSLTSDNLQLSIQGDAPLIPMPSASQTLETMHATVTLTMQRADGQRFTTAGLSFRALQLTLHVPYDAGDDNRITIENLRVRELQYALDDLVQDLDFSELDAMASLVLAALLDATDSMRAVWLGLLGLTDDLPTFDWQNFSVDAWLAWLHSLTTAQLQRWLQYLAQMLTDDTALPTIDGTGTRPDPWRIRFANQTGSSAKLWVTLAHAVDTDNTVILYPGFWVETPLTTTSDGIQLDLLLKMEFVAADTDAPPTTPLPALSILCHMYRTTGAPLVDQTYDGTVDATIAEMETIGQVTIDEAYLGFQRFISPTTTRHEPLLEFIGVEIANDTRYDVLDLAHLEQLFDMSGLDALMQGLLNKLAQHPLDRLAALLGLTAPVSYAGTAWSVPLNSAPPQLSDFLSDPMQAIGCYHSACLHTDIDGDSAYRYLIEDLAALCGVTLTSDATQPDAPYILPLTVDHAYLAITTSAGHINVHLHVHYPDYALQDSATMTLGMSWHLLQATLPDPCPGDFDLRWMPRGRVHVELHATPLEVSLANLATLQADALTIALAWEGDHEPRPVFQLHQARCIWADGTQIDLDLPDIWHLDSASQWDFLIPLSGLRLIVLGGSTGLGLALLLGWLPDDWTLPDIDGLSLPDWNTSPYAVDLPTFTPDDWSLFFDNPLVAVWEYTLSLLADAAWRSPVLHVLSGILTGDLPDLRAPDLTLRALDGIDYSTRANLITGAGTYDDPYVIRLHQHTQRPEPLIWFDPDPDTATHMGYGFRLLMETQHNHDTSTPLPYLRVRSYLRFDMARIPLTEPPASADTYVSLPAYHVYFDLDCLNPDAPAQTLYLLTGNADCSEPSLRAARLGVRVEDERIMPIVRLYDACWNGDLEDLIALIELPDFGFQMPARLRFLLDQLLQRMMAIPEVQCLLRMLEAYELATEIAPQQWILNAGAWTTMLAAPDDYFDLQTRAILTDHDRRAILFQTITTCFNLPYTDWRQLLFRHENLPATCAHDVLAALGILLPAEQGYMLNLRLVTRFLHQPQDTLQAMAERIWHDPLARDDLRIALANCGIQQSLPSFDPITVDLSTQTRYQFCIPQAQAIQLWDALEIWGCVTFDLIAEELDINLNARPRGGTISANTDHVHVWSEAHVTAIYHLTLYQTDRRLIWYFGDYGVQVYPQPDWQIHLPRLIHTFLAEQFGHLYLPDEMIELLRCLGVITDRNQIDLLRAYQLVAQDPFTEQDLIDIMLCVFEQIHQLFPPPTFQLPDWIPTATISAIAIPGEGAIWVQDRTVYIFYRLGTVETLLQLHVRGRRVQYAVVDLRSPMIEMHIAPQTANITLILDAQTRIQLMPFVGWNALITQGYPVIVMAVAALLDNLPEPLPTEAIIALGALRASSALIDEPTLETAIIALLDRYTDDSNPLITYQATLAPAPAVTAMLDFVYDYRANALTRADVTLRREVGRLVVSSDVTLSSAQVCFMLDVPPTGVEHDLGVCFSIADEMTISGTVDEELVLTLLIHIPAVRDMLQMLMIGSRSAWSRLQTVGIIVGAPDDEYVDLHTRGALTIIEAIVQRIASAPNAPSSATWPLRWVKRTTSDNAEQYGIQLLFDDALSLPIDGCRAELLIGGADATWFSDRSAQTYHDGIVLYVLEKSASDTLRPRAVLDVHTLELRVMGEDNMPLMALHGATLHRIVSSLVWRVDFQALADAELAGRLKLDELGIPLSSFLADSDGMANALLTSGDDLPAINPALDLEVGIVDNTLYTRLAGKDAPRVRIPVQKQFGAIAIEEIDIELDLDDPLQVIFRIDGSVNVGGLHVYLDNLTVTLTLTSAPALMSDITLDGMGVQYNSGGVTVRGYLLQQNGSEYRGLCLISAAGTTIAIYGMYATASAPDGSTYTALSIFGEAPFPIGGPPFFYVTGLYAGFGYNVNLTPPTIETLDTHPLLGDAGARLADSMTPRKGHYWAAAGVTFTSFALAQSKAVAYLILNDGFTVGIVGTSRLQLPQNNPLVSINMNLLAKFSSQEGLLAVRARIIDSWVLHPAIAISGDFAFMMWFAGLHAGDFLISMGGYHPAFEARRPLEFPHYPALNRLKYDLTLANGRLVITGESYFALTASAVMAGGSLEAVYRVGDLRASFSTWYDMLISWKPFGYDIAFGIKISIRYLGVGASVGVRLRIFGPEFSGQLTVDLWLVSFTISFGAGEATPPPLTWDEFYETFILPQDHTQPLHTFDAISGIIDTEGNRWIVAPEFRLTTETSIPISQFIFSSNDGVLMRTAISLLPQYNFARYIDIRPMRVGGLESIYHVAIRQADGTLIALTRDRQPYQENRAGVIHYGYAFPASNTHRALKVLFRVAKMPAAVWDYDDQSDGSETADAKTIPGLVGIEIIAEIVLDAVARLRDIAIYDYEIGVAPLPFNAQVLLPDAILSLTSADFYAELLDTIDPFVVIDLAREILAGEHYRPRREQTLDQLRHLGFGVPASASQAVTAAYLLQSRFAPPEIVSLYDGMAHHPSYDLVILDEPTVDTQSIYRLEHRHPQLTATIQQPQYFSSVVAPAVTTTVERIKGATTFERRDITSISANVPYHRLQFAHDKGAHTERGKAYHYDAYMSPRIRRLAETVINDATLTTHEFIKAQGDDRTSTSTDTSETKPYTSDDTTQDRLIGDTTRRTLGDTLDYTVETTHKTTQYLTLDKRKYLAPETKKQTTGSKSDDEQTRMLADTKTDDPPPPEPLTPFDLRAGTRINAGMTQIWDIPVRRATGAPLKVHIVTDMAVRVTALDKGGYPVLDIEVMDDITITLPENTARCALTGLGCVADVIGARGEGFGDISRRQSRTPLATTGWQAHSNLTQLSRHTLLARGSLIRVDEALKTQKDGLPIQESLCRASTATQQQQDMTTWLPITTITLGILIEHPKPEALRDTSVSPLTIDTRHTYIASDALRVVDDRRALLLYTLKTPKTAANAGLIRTMPENNFTISGVIGFNVDARVLYKAYQERLPQTLVDDGAITPYGQARIVFEVDNMASLTNFDTTDMKG